MADAIPSRLGQVNRAGDVLATFMKVFGGETLALFNRKVNFKDKHKTRSIPNGKSAAFPVFGAFNAPYYHNPGEEILGDRMGMNERVIYIDGQLIAPWFIANIDDAMIHYDYRQQISQQIAEGMAQVYDQNVARTIINAARETVPNVLGTYLGDTLDGIRTNAGFATTGATIADAIFDAGVDFDTRYIPEDGRWAALRPVQYALVVKTDKTVDTRLNANRTDLGGYASGNVKEINRIPLLKTVNLPNADDTTNPLMNADRQKDYSGTMGLIWHESAAATVNLREMAMESQYDMRRQGWSGLGKYIVGHGVLRPESAIELNTTLS